MSPSTHPRPRRPLAAPWLRFRIAEQLERLRHEPEWREKQRNAITLLKAPGLGLILVALSPGEALHEHRVPGTVVVQVLSGRTALRVGQEPLELGAGELVTMNPGISHEVRALEESTFLLTLGRTTSRHLAQRAGNRGRQGRKRHD